MTTLTTLISNTKTEIILSLTTLNTLILETITIYTDHTAIQYYMKNNSIPDYANYADFRDTIENNFITNYSD